MHKIKIAIVGVGNCASSLLQGINFYRDTTGNGSDVGLMHRQIGPYQPDDIEVVAAFDIDRRKVGLDVAEAIFALPNCTKVFCNQIKPTGAIVMMGCVFDGYAPHMREYEAKRTFLPLAKESTREQIIEELRRSGAEIMWQGTNSSTSLPLAKAGEITTESFYVELGAFREQMLIFERRIVPL